MVCRNDQFELEMINVKRLELTNNGDFICMDIAIICMSLILDALGIVKIQDGEKNMRL